MPGYALVARILMTPDDRTELRVVDANTTEQDILLKQELDGLEKNNGGKMKICHVLGQYGEGWKSKRGKMMQGFSSGACSNCMQRITT
ncbi:uncharacterized protein B0T23DRAFT_388471 [Neurospora hispaniola]|uniref:Oxidoreductase FAD/NAD(P)-binding domain-containing protein n=1 Tax=Neurospora hispaniola TaxID=588809 RepID=A0AAJ0I0W7_9PEZI|nr:hypothetical protein B0T23DRAFT_388471 [Neurospora hispaniola]